MNDFVFFRHIFVFLFISNCTFFYFYKTILYKNIFNTQFYLAKMLNPKISYFRVFYSAITKKNCPKLPKTLKLRIVFLSVTQVK